MVLGPIPSTAVRSAAFVNGPCASRYATTRRAMTGRVVGAYSRAPLPTRKRRGGGGYVGATGQSPLPRRTARNIRSKSTDGLGAYPLDRRQVRRLRERPVRFPVRDDAPGYDGPRSRGVQPCAPTNPQTPRWWRLCRGDWPVAPTAADRTLYTVRSFRPSPGLSPRPPSGPRPSRTAGGFSGARRCAGL